jgi:glucokinase
MSVLEATGPSGDPLWRRGWASEEGVAVCFDVGGTSIKSGVVDSNLELVGEAITTYPSLSDRDAESILDNLVDILLCESGKAGRATIRGLGFGFPGPFDYGKGISSMRGLGKYDSIYGLDLPSLIRSRLEKKEGAGLRLAADFPILFENDATLFALGEYLKGMAAGFARAICLTLGTGCGSTFLEDGRIVRGEFGVPENGAIYREPFGESIIDEYISRRGILRLAKLHGLDVEANDVRELASLARTGNPLAIGVFDEFGSMLGRGLEPFVERFRPGVIVLGGLISNAFDLFGSRMGEGLFRYGPTIRVSENGSRSALVGAAHLVMSVMKLRYGETPR